MVGWGCHAQRGRGSKVKSLSDPGREAARPWPCLLTLPLSTISFCRLVEVITRSRMACQDQDMTDSSSRWSRRRACPRVTHRTHLHEVCAGVEDPGEERGRKQTASSTVWPCDVMQGSTTAGQGTCAASCPGPGAGSGTHLSFTSSFTPELSWRAWFIMSCSVTENEPAGRKILPTALRGSLQPLSSFPAGTGSRDARSSPQSSAQHPQWPQRWLPSPCQPWPRAPLAAHPGS